MKLLMSWLQDYVKINVTPRELAIKLESIGFEVEDIINCGDIHNVVLGKILDIKQHPNADKLVVCTIDVGVQNKLSIVTGATNVKKNDYVPVALDGAILPDGKVIKSGPLRGELSQGMLCGPDEIGMQHKYKDDGILIVANGTSYVHDLGTKISTVFDLDDYVLDLSIPANRVDCQSVIGVAKEIAALYDKEFLDIDLSFETVKADVDVPNVQVDYSLASRYAGQVVTDIKIEQSPEIISSRLKKLGVSTINNIVDISNYVLLEVGQPLHAFDLDYVANGITVRNSTSNEKIFCLNYKEYTLDDSTTVIAGADGVLAIAGIIGGMQSAISNDTKSAFVESAIFPRASIRSSSTKLGLRTDSCARYQRGMYFDSADIGLKRALHLIAKYKFGTIVQHASVDKFESVPEVRTIQTTPWQISNLLGVKIEQKDIVKILSHLGFALSVKGENFCITVPSSRPDIFNYTDLAEEVIRFYGYDKLVPSYGFNNIFSVGSTTIAYQNKLNISKFLMSYGFNQTMTYSFIDSADYDKLGLDINNTIKLKNPLSSNQDTMRTQLASSLLHTIKSNINRKNKHLQFFEIGKVYIANNGQQPLESQNLCIAQCTSDIYQIKALCMQILGNTKEYKIQPSKSKIFNPYASLDILYGDELIGSIGQVHPLVLENFCIEMPVVLAELSIDALLHIVQQDIKAVPLSKHLPVERDLSIVVSDSVSVGDIIAVAKQSSQLNTQVQLADIYVGQQIESGSKSVTLNIEILEDRTLKDAEIAQCLNDINKSLSEKFSAVLRQ